MRVLYNLCTSYNRFCVSAVYGFYQINFRGRLETLRSYTLCVYYVWIRQRTVVVKTIVSDTQQILYNKCGSSQIARQRTNSFDHNCMHFIYTFSNTCWYSMCKRGTAQLVSTFRCEGSNSEPVNWASSLGSHILDMYTHSTICRYCFRLQ